MDESDQLRNKPILDELTADGISIEGETWTWFKRHLQTMKLLFLLLFPLPHLNCSNDYVSFIALGHK